MKKTIKAKSKVLIQKIKVDVSNKKPVKRVEVSQKDIDKNPSHYFDNVVVAKQYARNELIMLKDDMPWSEYSDRMWLITNYV